MKKILFLTATIISIASLQAQKKETKLNRIYMFGGGGLAFSDGGFGTLGISAVLNKKWISSIGYLKAHREASAPSDAEFRKAVTLFWGTGSYTVDFHPEAETQFTYLSFGRYYPSSKRVSYILDGGIGLAKGQDFNYYKTVTTLKPREVLIPGASNNYTVTETAKTSVGFIARAGMDWAFSGGAGMGFEIFYNLCTGGISDNIGF
ncbi:MAG TPA: hypothetical protein VLA58_09590, partial [Chitinophagaceae bacterium]|nr:hypothetical protein [Chitinophagaceae bacterium]